MRFLEIIILLITTILPFVKRPLLRVTTKKVIICLTLTILVLHLLIEGWRWQMLPAYLLMSVLIWSIASINPSKPNKLTFLRGFGYLGVILLLIPSWFLPNLLPVFSLPIPTGTYSVGTHLIHLKTAMDEPITKDPNDKRELSIKVWYPSRSKSGKQDPYLDQANRWGFIQKYLAGIAPTALNYLDKVKTHVYKEVPIADGPFPVLIFSHGYGSNATGYYTILSEMASHGYIVFNMNHSYESLGAMFANGNESYFNYQYQSENNVNSMQHIQPIKEAFANKSLSYDERHAIIREASKGYVVSNMIRRWSKDIIYVIDQLDTWNSQGFLKHKMDLDKIGAFGHSRGGGAAGQATIKDKRIKVAANLDGVQWGEMMDTIYQVPFLYVSADWPEDHEDLNSHVYKNKSTDYFYESKILTSAHPNFMDIPFMIPVRQLAQTGDIDPELCIKITNDLLTIFFDKHLKQETSASLEDIRKIYSLLELRVFEGDSLR